MAARPTQAVHRRRQVVALFAVAAMVWLVVTAASVAWSMVNPVVGPAGELPAVHVVQPGDTVWSIAREYQPTGDVRALVDRIVLLNGSASLQPGQPLELGR